MELLAFRSFKEWLVNMISFSSVRSAAVIAAVSMMPFHALAAVAPESLPLLQLTDLEYAGGFKVPSGEYGVGSANYGEGVIALGAGGNSMFMVGQANQQAIGELSIPALVKSLNIADFKTATVIQGFSKVLSRPESGNIEGTDLIAGMAYIDGKLVVNANVYYDGPGTSTKTTLVIKDASKLSTSAVGGYHSYTARAHASGWLSPVPAEWQSLVGGPFITGNSTGIAIVTRLSVGPSAFVFNPFSPDIASLSPSSIPVTKLLDYSFENPIGIASSAMKDQNTYIYNGDRTNGLWTIISEAVYGFVVPGTRTYMVVGHSGGMTSGVGYKITQDTGEVCGGPCAYKASDYDNFYWLFDMNDLLKVKAGKIASYSVVPYAYGRMSVPYAKNGYNAFSGGTYDPAKGLLYVTLERGQVFEYSWVPTVVAFKVNADTSGGELSAPMPPTNPAVQQVN